MRLNRGVWPATLCRRRDKVEALKPDPFWWESPLPSRFNFFAAVDRNLSNHVSVMASSSSTPGTHTPMHQIRMGGEQENGGSSSSESTSLLHSLLSIHFDCSYFSPLLTQLSFHKCCGGSAVATKCQDCQVLVVSITRQRQMVMVLLLLLFVSNRATEEEELRISVD